MLMPGKILNQIYIGWFLSMSKGQNRLTVGATFAKFEVFVDEKHDKLSTLYWLPKLHKIPYKSSFIANSSSYTTTLDLLPHYH